MQLVGLHLLGWLISTTNTPALPPTTHHHLWMSLDVLLIMIFRFACRYCAMTIKLRSCCRIGCLPVFVRMLWLENVTPVSANPKSNVSPLRLEQMQQNEYTLRVCQVSGPDTVQYNVYVKWVPIQPLLYPLLQPEQARFLNGDSDYC